MEILAGGGSPGRNGHIVATTQQQTHFMIVYEGKIFTKRPQNLRLVYSVVV